MMGFMGFITIYWWSLHRVSMGQSRLSNVSQLWSEQVHMLKDFIGYFQRAGHRFGLPLIKTAYEYLFTLCPGMPSVIRLLAPGCLPHYRSLVTSACDADSHQLALRQHSYQSKVSQKKGD